MRYHGANGTALPGQRCVLDAIQLLVCDLLHTTHLNHWTLVSMEYSKAYVDCLTALRRQLRKEQGLTIHLEETDAIPRMLVASLRSSEAETRALCERLVELR